MCFAGCFLFIVRLLKKHREAANMLGLRTVTTLLAQYDENNDQKLSHQEYQNFLNDLHKERERLLALEKALIDCGFDAFDTELLHSQIVYAERGMLSL